jgi:hypothetical protein
MKIPDHFLQHLLYKKIILYLAAYISPNKNDSLSNYIYDIVNQNPPNLLSIKLSIYEIKWNLK